MLMVILGAGASWDSVPGAPADATWRPPLTDGLFSRPEFRALFMSFPPVASLASSISDKLLSTRTTLERELRAVLDEAADVPAWHRELLAFRFYVQELIARCSEEWVTANFGLLNQVWLVRELEKWRSQSRTRLIYVTFNYDPLIDEPLAHLYGWDWYDQPDLQAYIDDSQPFELLKLHGSYNWRFRTSVHVEPSIRSEDEMFADAFRKLTLAGSAVETHEISIYDRDGIGSLRPNLRRTRLKVPNDVSRYAALPAIALPLTDKSSFACPESHVEKLKALIPQVHGIVAIGWRGMEKHFVSLLTALPPGIRFGVVSPNSPSTASRLATELPDATFVPARLGLTDLRQSNGLMPLVSRVWTAHQ
jgi:hypothetical protein